MKPGLKAWKTWDLRASHHFHQLFRNGYLSINFSNSTFALSYMFLVEDLSTVLHRNLYSSLISSPISLLAFLSSENPQWRSQLTTLWTSSSPRFSCSDAQNPPPSSKRYKCSLNTYSLFPVYCFNAELRKLQKSALWQVLHCGNFGHLSQICVIDNEGNCVITCRVIVFSIDMTRLNLPLRSISIGSWSCSLSWKQLFFCSQLCR